MRLCPFCGGKAIISYCDDEGNHRDEEYLQDAYSGVGYTISHSIDDNPKCPIAAWGDDGAVLGTLIYDTKQNAIDAWNGVKLT